MPQVRDRFFDGEPLLVAGIGDDHAITAARQREYRLVAQGAGFGEQVRDEQIMERGHDADIGQPDRQNVDERGHVEGGGLILDIDDVELLGGGPAANAAERAPAPGVGVGRDVGSRVIAGLGSAMIREHEQLVSLLDERSRQFLSEGANTPLHRRVFACDLADSHVVLSPDAGRTVNASARIT